MSNNKNIKKEWQKVIIKLLQEWPISQSFSRAAEVMALKKINPPAGGNKPILDLGCGNGFLTSVLFNNKKNYIDAGIDLDKKDIKKARKRPVFRKAIVADATKLPFKKNNFKTVIANSSLEHMKDLNNVVREVSRVLTNRGQFIFIVASDKVADYFLLCQILKKIGLKRVSKILSDFRNKLFKHYYLLGSKDWERMLKKHNLKLEKYKYIGGKRNWVMVELFLPFWIFGWFLNKIMGRWVVFFRKPAILLSKLFIKFFLPNSPFSKKGPGLLLIGTKLNEKK